MRTNQNLIKDYAIGKIGGNTMDTYQTYLSDVMVIMSIASRQYA